MSQMNVADLVGNVPTDVFSEDPVYYEDDGLNSFNFDVNFDGHTIFIRTVDDMNLPGQLRVNYSILDQNLCKIRHEIVSNMCGPETDVPIHVMMGLDEPTESWQRLTPDYFSADTRTIGELGTVFFGTESSMKRAFKTKFEKYRPFMQLANLARYYVFIVSSNSVVSNYPMIQADVRLLCARARLGMNIEAKIETMIGYSPFRDDSDNVATKHVKMVIESLNSGQRKQMADFNDDLTMFAISDPTPEEKTRANEILSNIWKETMIVKKGHRMQLDSYVENHRGEGSFVSNKRVCPIPLIVQFFPNDESAIHPTSEDFKCLPLGLREPWMSTEMCGKFESVADLDEELLVDIVETPEKRERHRNRRVQSFLTLPISEEGKLYNAKAGLWAKGNTHPEIAHHRKESQLNISLDSDVADIEEFVIGTSMTKPIRDVYDSDSNDLISLAKMLSENHKPLVSSLSIYNEFIQNTSFSVLGNYISDLMLELSLSISTYNKGQTFSLKMMKKHKCWMIVHNSGSLVFFSLCFEKSNSINLFPGKLGPVMFQSSKFRFSDWCSVSKEQIEHYLKAQSVLESVMTHALSTEGIDVTTNIWHQVAKSKPFWIKAKCQLLQFLANKRCAETSVTTTRYLYMSLFDSTNKDTYSHVKNFPDVIRSRLTVWIIKRLNRIIEKYAREDVKLVSNEGKLMYENVTDWRTGDDISVEELVDTFYHGYLSSKDRSVNSHSSFKICSKLFKEEYAYRKMLESGGLPFGESETPVPHSANKTVFKFFMFLFRIYCTTRVGQAYKEMFTKSFYEKLRKFTFSDASTLKASGRLGINEIPIEILEDFSHREHKFSEVEKKLKDKAGSLFKSRRKVLEGINQLVEEYIQSGEKSPSSYVDLLPYCLKNLEEQNGFDSDLFPKPQHEKDREVHVLVASGRVVQSVIELLSRSICEFFPSETLTHPDQKIRFVKDHYAAAGITFGRFVTLCKSADASTWCQNHHGTRFAAMLMAITDASLHGMIYRILALWVQKRITLPASLITNFLAHRQLNEAPEMWKKMRDEMMTRRGPFEGMPLATANIRSGMFQGILHYTSSLYHTFIQEISKDFEKTIFEASTGNKMLVTKIQGSDDSGSMNSFALDETAANSIETARRIMIYKEKVSGVLGVVNSRKTVLCAPFLIEYNSEWFLREKSIKPTFRWVSACSTLSVNESFISRYRQFCNLITSVLESGGSTLECALLQLSQATMHYKLMGSSTNSLFKRFKELMLMNPDPTLGFMPLSPDLTCGALGFDYDLYRVAQSTDFGHHLMGLETSLDESIIDYQGMVSEKKKSMMREGKFSFVERKVWDSVSKRMMLMSKEDILNEIDEDPELVFGIRREWESQKITIALKMYSTGVRSSLNNRTPLFKMSAAASYMLNRRFIKSSTNTVAESLLVVLLRTNDLLKTYSKDLDSKEDGLLHCFPLLSQYRAYDRDIQEACENMIILEADMTHRSRVVLTILDTPLPGAFSLMELCKRKWFGRKYNLPLGETSFQAVWAEAKENFKFVRDTLEETRTYLGMNTLQVKIILEGVYHKTRKIKMQDTQGRSGSTFSSLLRAYWPRTRITYLNSNISYGVDVILSNLFLLCAGPFVDTWAAEQCTKILQDTTVLDSVHKNGSMHHKLKMMKDAVSGAKPLAIVETIKASRLGVVGFFSIRQEKIGPKYYGRGEWRGVIGSCSVIISMNNEEIDSITISSLSDPDFLSRSLFLLTRELGFRSFKIKPSNCGVFFTSTGKLRHEARNLTGTGVTLDRDLKINFLERITKKPLRLSCVEYGLRLIAEQEDGRCLTLLSVPMHNSYWIKECPPLVDDEFFKKLHSDTPTLLYPIIHKLSHNMRSKRVRGHLSGKRLESLFLREMGIYDMENDFRDLDQVDSLLSTSISDEELKQFMSMVSHNYVLEEHNMITDWSEDDYLPQTLLQNATMLSDDTMEMSDRMSSNSCGMTRGLKFLSFEMSYRQSSSTKPLAQEILIEKRTDLILDKHMSEIWGFMTGKNFRTVQLEPDLPPSLSAVSGAMSEHEIVENLTLLQTAGVSDIMTMRSKIISYQEKLLAAIRRRDGKIPKEDRLVTELKSIFGYNEKLRLMTAFLSLKDYLGFEESDEQTLFHHVGLDEGWDLSCLDKLANSTETALFVVLNGEDIWNTDGRNDEMIEDDPESSTRLKLIIDGGSWKMELHEAFMPEIMWKYPRD